MDKKLCSLFLALALLLTLCVPARAAETENGGGANEEETADDFAISPQNPVLAPGATQELTIETTETNVRWNVADPQVASLNATEGTSVTVTALAAGRTDITAEVTGTDKIASCSLTVSGVVLTPTALTLDQNESGSLTLVPYGDAANVEWTWTIEPEGVATIEKTAAGCDVQAIGLGEAVIACRGGDYSVSCALTVAERVVEAAEVTLSQTALVLAPGGTGTLTATSTARATDIKWSVDSTRIATVSPAAGDTVTVTGVATGETVLKAQVGGGPVARCTVVVSGIAFSTDSLSVEAGAFQDLTVLTFGDSRNIPASSWEWSSSQTSVATVSATSTGVTVRGVQAGSSTITVTIGDYTASCLVTVTAVETTATISLSEATITMAPGTSSRLRATTIADSADIQWSIGDNDITSIASKSGYTIILMAGNPGQTTITARVGNSDPASCTIIVSGVTLSSNSVSLVVNGEEKITLTSYGDAQTIPNWEWSSSNTGVAIVTKDPDGATVHAVGAGTSTLTCSGGSYTVLCQVEVAANSASDIEASLNGGILRLSSVLARLRNVCQEMTEEELSYITNINVSTKLGTLYDGYVSEGDTGFGVSNNRNYYVSSAAYLISNITFVPKPDVNGTVRIRYDGYTVNNKTFEGSIIVSVGQQETTLSYASLNGAPVHFRSEDFFNYSMSVYNRSLQYLTFTMPASRYGTLYYSYVNASVYESIVSGGTRYYRTYNPSISNVAFVPNPSYSGTFSLRFTGYDTEGVSFAGTVRISVNNPNGSDNDDESLRERLHYETGPGARVYFEADDFINECKDRTGYDLVSIHFRSLPASSEGRIYCGRDDAISRNEEFYVSSGDRISDLNFVARRNYTGNLSVPFTGTTDRDTSFTGEVEITVSRDGAYLIRMAALSGTRVYLSTADFSDICRVAGENDFHHVSFPNLPATGSLYYDNGSVTVTPGALYYRSGTEPYLSNVNYLSPDSFSGTVRIPFHIWDAEGNSFTGHLSIAVTIPGGGNTSGDTTAYLSSGPAVPLRASDIITPAEEEIGDVTTVRLTPPEPAAGKLLLNYVSPGQYSPFDSAREYSADTIGQVYFLPKAGFSGTAAITYVARNRYNMVYSGILRIQVRPPERSAYFTDLTNRAWAVPAVDFFRYYGAILGTTPTTYEPDGPARRGAYLTVLGRMYNFPDYPGNGGYEDVGLGFYYTPYIAAGRALGVTEASQYFYPGEPISRQDAAVYLYRCLRNSGQAVNAPIDNLYRFHDAWRISYYAVEAMSALVELGVFQGTEEGNLNPQSTLTRLQMAAILYRALT